MTDLLWKGGAIVLLLGALIVAHELGHFAMAKLFRVKVLKFAIGFGPALLRVRVGETDYQLCALPLGGFVRMAGESPDDDVSVAERGRTFLGQPPWKRSLIALAGPAMNLLFPVLIYFAVFASQKAAYSTRVGEVDPDMPAGRAGLRPGDRIAAIEGTPVKYFHDLQAIIGPRYEQPTRVAVDRGGKTVEVTLTPVKDEAGDVIEKRPWGRIGIAVNSAAPIIGVAGPDSPAGRAGLATFDRVFRAGGSVPRDFPDLERLLQTSTQPFEVEALREVDLGLPGAPASKWTTVRAIVTPVVDQSGSVWTGIESPDAYVFTVRRGTAAETAGVRRGDRVLAIDGQSVGGWLAIKRCIDKFAASGGGFALTLRHDGTETTRRVELQRETCTDDTEREVTRYTFGANGDVRDESRVPAELIPIATRPGEALRRAAVETASWIRKMVLVLVALCRGDISFRSVGGPIMLGDIAVRAAEQGRDTYLQAMALISVNLGVMNLLPVPVLDGFHVLAAAWEWIRRRPLPTRARAVATYIGLGLLATLMILVIKNDAFRYFLSETGPLRCVGI